MKCIEKKRNVLFFDLKNNYYLYTKKNQILNVLNPTTEQI